MNIRYSLLLFWHGCLCSAHQCTHLARNAGFLFAATNVGTLSTEMVSHEEQVTFCEQKLIPADSMEDLQSHKEMICFPH